MEKASSTRTLVDQTLCFFVVEIISDTLFQCFCMLIVSNNFWISALYETHDVGLSRLINLQECILSPGQNLPELMAQITAKLRSLHPTNLEILSCEHNHNQQIEKLNMVPWITTSKLKNWTRFPESAKLNKVASSGFAYEAAVPLLHDTRHDGRHRCHLQPGAFTGSGDGPDLRHAAHVGARS